MATLDQIEDVIDELSKQHYLADRSLATAIFLCLKLKRPLFLEGEPGVGKTAVAQAMAEVLQVPLIRLQCYEGIDRESALYEWNYPKQLLAIRLYESSREHRPALNQNSLYQADFLLKRPLFEALVPEGPAPVLLIDEIDRSDDEFEAFLLEILSEFQISIPELGTIRAKEKPFIVLTSNRTRDVHDALKRRCIYHWLDYPSFERELAIVALKVPGLDQLLRRDIVSVMQRLRQEPLEKKPGVAEALDWANALEWLMTKRLSPEIFADTLGVLLKDREDIKLVQEGDVMTRILRELNGDDRNLP